MYGYTHGQTQRESPWVALSWQFELLLWGISWWFSSGRSFWFVFTAHIWYISGSSDVCTYIFKPRWIVPKRCMGREHPLASLPCSLQGASLYMCGQRELLTSRMRNMSSGQGPTSSFDCPAVLTLEFWSKGNESPIALLWEALYLLPHVGSFFFSLNINLYNLAISSLNCGMWNLVPWLGIEPGLPVLGVWRLSHWIPVKSQSGWQASESTAL